MNRNLTATLLTALMMFSLSGFAAADDSVVGAESVSKAASEEWVPEGFESLNEPQVTEIDLYYADEFLASVFVRFTQQQLSFLETDSITLLLKNLSDPESVKLLLEKPFETNVAEICHSQFQLDCGTLQTDSIEIIFDRAMLRADLFISPEFLLAGQPLQDRFLPDSSSGFSLFTDSALLFSGVDLEETTFNLANTTRISVGESRLLMRSNVTDTQGLTVDTLAWQKEYQGKDYQLGLFRGNASNFRFMTSEQFVGASMASSVLTRIDLEQSLGTEIELFFGTRSRIEISRDDRLLASGYYDAGNQIIDTSMLPSGSYDIDISITDASGVVTTEQRFFSKTSRLPPADQAIYFLQAGQLTDRSLNGGIPELQTSILRGGFSKRLTPSLGADIGFSVIPESTMYQAGIFKMGKSFEIKSEVAFEDNGAMGADVSVRWDLDFIRLNLSSRKIWEGDSQLQLGEGGSQNSFSADVPTRWGNVGVFARTNKRSEGFDSSNYGLRWQTKSFAAKGGNFSAGLEVSKNDDDFLAMFSLSYRFNGDRSQHAFTPAFSHASNAVENYRQSMVQGSHLSNWTYGEEEQRRLSLRADRFNQTSFEARYEDQREFGDTDFGARYNVSTDQLEYNGRLSTSFGYTKEATGFGGRAQGESAFIINVDGVPENSEFDVIINGSSRGTTLSGKRLLVPVAPYETYRVELTPLGDSIIDLDNGSYRKTVYPGNVIALDWSARTIKIIIGRIVDTSGTPIKDAIIRNVNGFGVTDNQGFFQVEIDEGIESLIIQKGTSICEANFEMESSDRNVASLGTLTCEEVSNPIVRIFPEQEEEEGQEEVVFDQALRQSTSYSEPADLETNANRADLVSVIQADEAAPAVNNESDSLEIVALNAVPAESELDLLTQATEQHAAEGNTLAPMHNIAMETDAVPNGPVAAFNAAPTLPSPAAEAAVIDMLSSMSSANEALINETLILFNYNELKEFNDVESANIEDIWSRPSAVSGLDVLLSAMDLKQIPEMPKAWGISALPRASQAEPKPGRYSSSESRLVPSIAATEPSIPGLGYVAGKSMVTSNISRVNKSSAAYPSQFTLSNQPHTSHPTIREAFSLFIDSPEVITNLLLTGFSDQFLMPYTLSLARAGPYGIGGTRIFYKPSTMDSGNYQVSIGGKRDQQRLWAQWKSHPPTIKNTAASERIFYRQGRGQGMERMS